MIVGELWASEKDCSGMEMLDIYVIYISMRRYGVTSLGGQI
jgi:hypothetical protein